MAVFSEGKHVLSCTGVIIWDGITKPERQEDGSFKYSVKVAIPEMAPEKGELEQLATRTLNESEFKGHFPAGGSWPLIPVDMVKLAADAHRLQGHISFNAKSSFVPDVFDMNGNPLDATAYGKMLYPGAMVQVLVGAYAFNNKSKGIAFNLEGIKLIDASTPQLSVGGGMAASEKANIMGGGGGAPAGMPATPQVGQPAPAVTPPTGVQPSEAFIQPPGGAPTPAPTAAPAEKMWSKDGQSFPESAMVAQGWTAVTLQQNGWISN